MSFDPRDPDSEEDLIDEEVWHVAEPEVIDESGIPVAEIAELETSYLHPTSLVFTVISQLRQNLIPAIIALFGAARGNYVFVAIAAGIFILSVTAATIRYLTLRYSIHNGELTVQSGLIFRRLRKVPISRIQNIDLVQNVLHRLLGVAEVRVETASGTEPEATLRVLSLAQVEQLRAKVQRGGLSQPANSTQTIDGQPASAENTSNDGVKELLRIPTWWLFNAGLASNRGMVLIGFLIGLYYQNAPEENRDFRNVGEQLEGISKFLPDLGEGVQLYIISALAVILMLVLIRLLGIGWFILRFYGYRLTQQGDDFKLSCGLFTKVSATVPIRRIQFISIHRSLIMRWMGLASIRIETAGGSGKNTEDATTTVSKRWFIPVVPEYRIPDLMANIRPDLEWTEDEFDWQPLAPKSVNRFVRIAIVLSLVLMLVGVLASRPWGWVPGLVASPLLVMYYIRRSRSTKYTRIRDGIIFRSGVYTRKTSITFFEKIQGASIAQSPFDRRWGMSTLAVDTAAAGPANHTISIRFLDESFAAKEYELILQRSSQHVVAPWRTRRPAPLTNA